MIAVDTHSNKLARDGEGHHDDPAIHAAKSLAEIGQGVYGQFDLLMISKGLGNEVPRRLTDWGIHC